MLHDGSFFNEEEPFRYQADSLLEQITAESPSFLMGDFNNNAYVRDEGYDNLLSKNLVDTYELAAERDDGVTVEGEIAGWNENKVDLRIDLVLASEKIEVTSSKVIFNGKNKPVVSDHYGVEVVIAIPSI